jgi:hypothetical protein
VRQNNLLFLRNVMSSLIVKYLDTVESSSDSSGSSAEDSESVLDSLEKTLFLCLELRDFPAEAVVTRFTG